MIALIMGYIVTGIQSLISALLMEFVINPRIADNGSAVLLGGLLGALSGLSLLLAFDPANTRMTILIAAGFVIGLIVGALSRWHFQRDHALRRTKESARDFSSSRSGPSAE
jgi:energy-converting hydrogenase Eha subunit B